MHPQQRHARFNLIVISCAVGLMAVCYAALIALFGPKVAPASFGFLGICGILGFSNLFYRKKGDPDAVVMDERDEDIKRRALVIAWGVGWLVWGLLCMAPWFVAAIRFGFGPEQQASIPINCLPAAYMSMMIVHTCTWSIAVLVLYGKGADDSET